MGTNNYANALNSELNDLRREREILAEEVLSEKNCFASNVKDVLGEQLIRELSNTKIEPTVIKKEKAPSKIKRIFESLFKILQ